MTRRTKLLTMNCERNEHLRDFISRVESMAGVCHVDKGLTKEEVTLLAILRGTSSELRIKILHFFIEKTATVKALKIFADNLRASEVRLSGGVKLVVRPGKPGQPRVTCDRCKKPNHQAMTYPSYRTNWKPRSNNGKQTGSAQSKPS